MRVNTLFASGQHMGRLRGGFTSKIHAASDRSQPASTPPMSPRCVSSSDEGRSQIGAIAATNGEAARALPVHLGPHSLVWQSIELGQLDQAASEGVLVNADENCDHHLHHLFETNT